MPQYLEIIPLLRGRATRPWGGPVRWCSVQWCSTGSAACGSMAVRHAVLRCAACSTRCAVMQPCSVLHVAGGTWCAVLQLCSVQGCSVGQCSGAVVRRAACSVQRCSHAALQPGSVAALQRAAARWYGTARRGASVHPHTVSLFTRAMAASHPASHRHPSPPTRRSSPRQ